MTRPVHALVLAAIAACVAALLQPMVMDAAPPQLVPVADPIGDAVPCPPRGLTIDAEIVRVIDGDTLRCRSSFDYDVRLLDCWAPETRTTDPDEKQRGIAARDHLQQLVADRPVRIHIPAGRRLSDVVTFGRLLGDAWPLDATHTPERVSLSRQMVRDGHATESKEPATW